METCFLKPRTARCGRHALYLKVMCEMLFTEKEREDLCYMHDNNPGALFDATVAAVLEKQASTETWIVVKEHVWDHGDVGRPTLAYLLPSEFGRATYSSFEAASAFIKAGAWPIGWVAMKLDRPPAAQAAPLPESAYCWNCGEPDPGCGGHFKKDGAACKFHGTAEVVS